MSDITTVLSNPFMFVVGCPRSGTTLLQRMLDNHPQLTVANDTHFITQAAKRVLREDSQPLLTTELIEAVKSYRRLYRLGLNDQEVESAAKNCQTYAEFVSRLYELRGKKNHKPLSGEKTPDYCRKMPALHTLFPTARFVEIVRDGRNTALSALDWATRFKSLGKWALWNEDPVGTCALWWRWQAGAGQRDGLVLGDEVYYQVKYEDLVENPKKELQAITTFLDLPFSDAMSNYYIGKTKHTPGLSAKSAWLPPTRNLRDWRKDMPVEDVNVFEGIAGDLLRDKGYTCLDNPSSDAVVSRVHRCLTWWSSESKD